MLPDLNSEVLAIRKDHQDLVTYSTQRPNQVIHGGNYQTKMKDLKELGLKIIGVLLIPT